MNKKNTVIILIIDLIIIIAMIYLLRNRYIQYRSTGKAGQEIEDVSPRLTRRGRAEDTRGARQGEDTVSITPLRNILFQYRSRKAHNVSIRGDFNGWTPQPLTKDKNHVWKITMALEPGKYLYNYLVDGKVILDPYNRKSEPNTSRGFKSSVLELKPLKNKKQ